MSVLSLTPSMPLLAQIAEGVEGLSAAQILGSEARVIALTGLMSGLVLWLVGGRVLRLAFAVLGTAMGAFMGLILLPLTGMAPIETGWASLPTLSPEQLGLFAGGLLGLVFSVALFRAVMAIGAGLVFAGVGVLAGLIFISQSPASPPGGEAQPADGVDSAYLESIDSDASSAGETVSIEDMVTTSALEQARAWSESRGQEVIDGGLDTAEHAGFDVDQARQQLANAAEKSSAFLHKTGQAFRRHWDSLEVRQRLLLLGSSLAGLAAGLLFGLVAPNRSAALISSMGGSAVVIGCGLMLADSYGLGSHALLDQPAPTWAIVWGVASALGLVFQVGVLGRRGGDDWDDDEDED